MFETILKKGKRLVAYALTAALIFGSVRGNYLSVYAEAEGTGNSTLVYNGQCQFPTDKTVTVVGPEVTPGDVSQGEYACYTDGVNAGTHILFNNQKEEIGIVINPKEVTAVWQGSDEFTYTGEPITLPEASVDTGITGETISLTYSVSDGDQEYAVDNVKSAGTYTITAAIGAVSGEQAKLDNYLLSNETYTITIAQAENQFAKNVSCSDVILGELPQPYNAEATFGTVKYRYYDNDGNLLEYTPYQIGSYYVEAYVEETADYAGAISSKQAFDIVYGALPGDVDINAVLDFGTNLRKDKDYYYDDVVVIAKEGYVLCDQDGNALTTSITITQTTKPYTFYVRGDNAILPAVMSVDNTVNGKVMKIEQDILIDKITPGFDNFSIKNAEKNGLIQVEDTYWTNSDVTISFTLKEEEQTGQTQTQRTVTVSTGDSTDSTVISEEDGQYTITIAANELTDSATTYGFTVEDEAGNSTTKIIKLAKDITLPKISEITITAENKQNENWLNAAELMSNNIQNNIIVTFKLENVLSGIHEIYYQVPSVESVYTNKLQNVEKAVDGVYSVEIPGTAWIEGANQLFTVKVTDNAQNVSTAEKTFSIDVTLPEEEMYMQYTSDINNKYFLQENNGFISGVISLFENAWNNIFGKNKVSYELYIRDIFSDVEEVVVSYNGSEEKLFKTAVKSATVGNEGGYSVFMGEFAVATGEHLAVTDLSVVSVTDGAGNVSYVKNGVLVLIDEDIYVDAINPELKSVTVKGQRGEQEVTDDLSTVVDEKLYYKKAPTVDIAIHEQYFGVNGLAPSVEVIDVSSGDVVVSENDLSKWTSTADGHATYSIQLPEVENEEREYYIVVSYADASENKLISDKEGLVVDADGVYKSGILVVDMVAPVVEFGGYYIDSEGEVAISSDDILTYASESNESYNYFDQEQFNQDEVSEGDAGEASQNQVAGYGSLYWKLQIKEHNFRVGVDDDYNLNMIASWLDGTEDVDQTSALWNYMKDEQNWLVDSQNHDIHYIMIPISEEARYDIRINYADLAGNIQENAVQDHVVYDVTKPAMEVLYSQTLVQKVKSALSKYFWFFKDEVTATITVTDNTAGAYFFEVYGGTVEDQIANNEFESLGFTLDYTNDANGAYEFTGSLKDEKVEHEQVNGVTTITIKIPAQYRGSLSAIAYDKTNLHTGTYEVVEEELPVIIVVDNTNPVLDTIKYNEPEQVVDPVTKETVTEQTNVYDGYDLYYDKSIDVTFDITEANWFEGIDEDQEKYFKELLTVKLYRADEMVDRTSAGWKKVEDLNVTWKRLDHDTYQLAFTIPADQEEHTGDGHYYYTITAKDYSENLLIASEDEASKAGYKAEMLTNGTYISPVMTIDTINPQVAIQYYDENQAVDYAQGVHEYYQGASATIELTVTEHNFRPADAIISMTAVDVNDKEDQVDSVIAANALIQESIEALKVNVNNAVWTRNGDVYTTTIVMNSPEVDANYTFGISYKDMANQDADKYYYNGAEEAASTPVQGDIFTVDSVAPVITAIDNDAASDMTYKPENSSDWAKFLNYATFGYFWKEKIVVTIVAHDDISGVNTITYDAYLTENDAVTKKEAVAAATVKAINKVDGDNAVRYITFRLAPDFKGDVVAHAVDFADNTCEDETLKGVVLESAGKHQADGEHARITITTPASRNVNGINYYNSDVAVSFRYEDTYSGLNSVKYSLAGSGTYEKNYMNDNQDLVYIDEIGGVVESGKNNYNGVIITSEYVDNAGYSGSISETINIDVTKPEISVVYDENEPRNDLYYNKVRTATVTIKERNFQESDVVFSITNTDGTMPEISGWSHSAANGVSDETTHTCTVTFDADGDYTFTVGCQDMAGNTADYGRVDEFTIDLTVPEVTVLYDNNDYQNGHYYDDYRTATISIMEHNFNSADVRIVMTAQNDGVAVEVPDVSSWLRSGDLSRATIYYNKDAEYTFDITFMDMAGNEMATHQQEHFVIDTIAPELEITDVKNYTAHNGKIQPTITYSDVNRDEESFDVTLEGYKNGKITPDYLSTDIHNGVEIVLQDLERIRKNDDLYTLRASVMDKAGNTSEAEVIYSVNRFGSIFVLDEATEKFVNDYYHMQEQDLVVREINVDIITSAEITYSVNGQVVTMAEDDYTVVSTGTRDTWKENVYTLKKENFATEGEYSVTITSKDDAKNAMSNKTYSSDEDGNALVAFVIDKTNPYCIVTGVEDGEQYNEESRTVTIDARDNTYLDTLQVLLDGVEVASYNAEQLSEVSGVVTLTVGSSNKKQTLEVIAKDKAGNTSENKTITFLITTNLFYQYINNKVAVGGTVAGVGVLAVAGGVVSVMAKGAAATAAGASGAGAAATAGLIGGFFALFKRRKKEDEEE